MFCRSVAVNVIAVAARLSSRHCSLPVPPTANPNLGASHGRTNQGDAGLRFDRMPVCVGQPHAAQAYGGDFETTLAERAFFMGPSSGRETIGTGADGPGAIVGWDRAARPWGGSASSGQGRASACGQMKLMVGLDKTVEREGSIASTRIGQQPDGGTAKAGARLQTPADLSPTRQGRVGGLAEKRDKTRPVAIQLPLQFGCGFGEVFARQFICARCRPPDHRRQAALVP